MSRPNSTFWIALIVAVSAAFNFPFACTAPLVAIAVIAALTLSTGQAMMAVLTAWLINQLIGYTLLGYPVDTMSFVWGAIIGFSALVTLLACQFVKRKLPASFNLLTLTMLFVAGLIANQGSMYGVAVLIGDGTDSFTPDIISHVLATNVIGLVIYSVVYIGLTRLKSSSKAQVYET